MQTIDRVICGLLGASMFGSVTYVAVMEAGGVTSEDAPILITVGLGAIGAAYYTGHAWRTGAWHIAVVLFLGIIAAELSNFQRTVERLAVLRETRLVPVQQAKDARARAEGRITRARQEVERLTADSPRLIAAMQRQQQVADAAAERSAGRHCKDRCIRESGRQIELAAAEVASAREELDHKRANAAAELREAINALAAIPPARPVSALANWLGVDPRTTVIVQSTTIGVAVLVLAIGLLHLAGRGPVPVAQSARDEALGTLPHTTPGVADEGRRLIAQEPRETPHGVADRFLLDAVYPTPSGSVAVDDLRDVYLDWCDRRHREPLPDEEIAGAINDIFRRVGLPVIDVDGTRVVIGVGLKEQGAGA